MATTVLVTNLTQTPETMKDKTGESITIPGRASRRIEDRFLHNYNRFNIQVQQGKAANPLAVPQTITFGSSVV